MNNTEQNYRDRLEAAENEIKVLKQQIQNLEEAFLKPSYTEAVEDAGHSDQFI